MTASKPKRRFDAYALTWRMPIIVWQILFFVGPLLFMIAMTFFLVKNYRMHEAFEMKNWFKMLSRGYFWDGYFPNSWPRDLVDDLCDHHRVSCGLCIII